MDGCEASDEMDGCEASSGISQDETRRKLIASWLWLSMMGRSLFFAKAFLSTGSLMGLNGENEVSMRGIPGMDQ
jgi:hypothetical protein